MLDFTCFFLLQVECLQLSWGQVLCQGDLDSCRQVLKLLFARFGSIIHRAFPKSDNTVLDDPQYITQIPSENEEEDGLFITTRKYIRQMVCIFLALFRYAFTCFVIFIWKKPNSFFFFADVYSS
jgi:hypothetical protein